MAIFCDVGNLAAPAKMRQSRLLFGGHPQATNSHAYVILGLDIAPQVPWPLLGKSKLGPRTCRGYDLPSSVSIKSAYGLSFALLSSTLNLHTIDLSPLHCSTIIKNATACRTNKARMSL